MKRATSRLPGFTLIELMIATVLGSMLLLTAGSLFMTFMIGNANTNARRQMSAEGIQMLGTLEFHIRNAKSAIVGASTGNGSCTGTPNNTLTLTKLDGDTMTACFRAMTVDGVTKNRLFFFTADGETCAGTAGKELNSDFVTTGTNSFTCTTAANGKQTLTVQFGLSTSEGGGITETFSRIIQLRNS